MCGIAGIMFKHIREGQNRSTGQALIDMLDDAGYLTGDLDEVAVRLGINTAEVESVLTTARGC